jgi:hypothetical protein
MQSSSVSIPSQKKHSLRTAIKMKLFDKLKSGGERLFDKLKNGALCVLRKVSDILNQSSNILNKPGV